MQRSYLFGLSVLGALTAFAPPSNAHIALMSPKPRSAELKEGPCGNGPTEARTKNVTTFVPGQTITVTWQETIGHPSHYRISFDPNGTGAFVDPKSFTDLNTAPSVLLDNIADKSGTQTYSQEITLPDIECDKCTLQLIQVMTDKPPYGDGNDLYYQCADLVLSKSAVGTVDDAGASSSSGSSAAPASKDDGGCATSSRPSRSGWFVLTFVAAALGLFATRRRRG